MNSLSYDDLSPEVRTLWNAGAASFDLPWRNYPREFRLDDRHVDELLRIVIASGTDDEARRIEWVATHARRALGELGAVAVIEPLMEQAKDDDGVILDLPILAGLIGPPAIPHLRQHLRYDPEYQATEIVAIEALMLVGAWHRDAMDDVAEILCTYLEGYANRAIAINGALIAALRFLWAPKRCEVMEEVLSLPTYYIEYGFRSYPRSIHDAVEAAP